MWSLAMIAVPTFTLLAIVTATKTFKAELILFY